MDGNNGAPPTLHDLDDMNIDNVDDLIANYHTVFFGDDQDAPIPTDQASSIVPVSGVTKAAKDLGWSRGPGESGKRPLFIHVTRTSDGSTDGLNISRSAKLRQLKSEFEDSFTGLVPSTYTIRYHGEAIETDLAWKNCVKAFRETGNRCMKLFIHE